MKRLLSVLLITLSFAAKAQIQFEEISLDEALQKASKTGKMVFVHFVSATCEQCNEVAEKGFENKELGTAFNEKCVAIRMHPGDAYRHNFIDKYNHAESIGSFFIRSDGDLLYRTTTTSSWGPSYLPHLEKAWNKLTEGRLALKQLDEMWALDKSVAAMEENLLRRQELFLNYDSLLDVYALSLPQDSFTSARTICFIAKLAPALASEASNLIRKDYQSFLRGWYTIGLQQRVEINNRIIGKTMSKAVEQKDKKLVYKTASFVYNIYTGSDTTARHRRVENLWMHYYLGTKDSAIYCQTASRVYDTYLMSLSKASLQQRDSIANARRREAAKKDTVVQEAGKRVIRSTYTQSSILQHYSNDLMFGAKNLYRMSTNASTKEKALSYAKRAVELFESSETLDTYAKLLYNLGSKELAIATEEKAVKKTQESGYRTERFLNTLKKMKDNEVITL